jgi:hypothetical protein
VMYYPAIITPVMMPHDDPGENERPCLRAGYHNRPSHANDRPHFSFSA